MPKRKTQKTTPKRGPKRGSVQPRSRLIKRAPRTKGRVATSTQAIGPGSSTITSGRGHLGHYVRVTGSEYITSVVIPEGFTEVPGAIYLNLPNIAGPPRTRLQNFATVYQRWHARKYSYRFISAQPTSTKGTVVMAQDSDPLGSYTSGSSENIARLRSLEGSRMFQVWQNATSDLASSGDYTSLWTTDPAASLTEGDRLDIAGRMVLACVAPTGVTSGNVLGSIELDYVIDFYVPRLAAIATIRSDTLGGPPISVPYADGSWIPTTAAEGVRVVRATALAAAAAYKSATSLGAASGITDVVREFVAYDQTASMDNEADAGATGWPRGDYTVTITAAADLKTPATLFTTPGTMEYQNISYVGGYDSASPLFGGSFVAADNTVYSCHSQATIDFGVSKGLGYADLTVIPSTESPPTYWEVSIRTAGQAAPVVFSSMGVKRVSRKSPSPLSPFPVLRPKAEARPRTEAKTMVEPDDGDDESYLAPSPPTSRSGLPSSAPGGTFTKPATSTSSTARTARPA